MEQQRETTQWTTHAILDTLAQHRAQLRELGVRKIGFFGSHSRGEASAGSDIDFLVTLDPMTFDNYANLMNLLEDLFRCKVDLVPEQSIRPALRPHIMKDAIYVPGV